VQTNIAMKLQML